MMSETATAPAPEAPSLPMSLRGYARRRGTSAPSVLRAIRRGRLVKSLVWVAGVAQIADPDLADQEWAANTDHSRAPGAVKEGAARAGAVNRAVTQGHVTQETPKDAEPPAGSLAASSRDEKFWKARQAELDYRREAGELVDVKAVAKEAFERSRIIRDALLNVPSRIAAELAAETDPGRMHMKLDAAIREALNAAADGLERMAAS